MAEARAIVEPDAVVRVAAQKLDLLVKSGVQVGKGLAEELRQEEERRSLVEAVAFVVDEGAAAAGVVVLLEDGNAETGLCEAGCEGNTASSSA